ncbi:MAG: ATP-binding protein [Salinivirgaceae bacterium]|jgi:signal transduction histidine kinase/ligand-binding sensor domain-containing protein/DNA-binding response OmpR family regulator|nr:ATP-binding protein [Salinivirgaceae bacterium]
MDFSKRNAIIIAFFVMLLFSKAQAQLEHIAIQNITQKNGLSNNYINCIIQDTSGFIWIGTNDGLNRYDGYTIKNYYNDPADTSTVSDNKITALCVDFDGVLWIGTESNSLCRYNPFQDNFIRYASLTYGEKMVSNHFITDIKTDNKGRLWVLTQEGLNIYNKQGDYFEPINFGLHYKLNTESIESLKNNQLPDNVINVAITLKNIDFVSKDIFIETMQKTAEIKLSEYHILEILSSAIKWIPENEKNYNQFITLAPDTNDNLWLLYQDGGFAYYNPISQKIKKYSIPYDSLNGDAPNQIRSIIVDGNNLWLGTFNNGVYEFSVSSQTFKKVFDRNKQGALTMSKFENYVLFFSEQYLHLYPLNKENKTPAKLTSKKFPEINFNVTDILKDNARNYWIASEGAGLFLMYQYKKFNIYDDTKGSKIRLSKREVTSLYADKKDNLYVGYYRNNIDKINLYKNTIETIRDDKDFEESSAPGSVFALTTDAKDNLWVGSYYAGLQKMNGQTRKFEYFNQDDIKDVRGIVIDKNENIWAIAHGHGLIKYNKNGKFIQRWVANYVNWETNIPDNWINDICIDKNENLWIASSQGLCVTDTTARVFKSYRKSINDSTSISHNSINTVYCDSKNNIWVGTWNGLNYFNRNNETFTHYSILDGLANNSINSIIEDNNGDIWLSTNLGLTHLILDSKVAGKINYIKNYDSYDGVPGEFYLRTVAKIKSGTLFFGGKNGLTWFNPDSIKPNTHLPTVAITDLKIFNLSIFDKNSSLKHLRANFIKDRSVVLNYEQNIIGIDFTALNFIPNNKNTYKCKLEGFDTKWQQIGSAHTITYTNMEPGTYFFTVKTINSDGLSNSEAPELKITILPPFWRSNLGYTLIAIMVLALLTFLFLILRTRVILINRIKMRQLEADNLRGLDKSKNSFFTNVTHEFRTPITLILGPIKKILNTDPSKLDINDIKTHLKLVNRNAELLMRLVNQILDFKKADAGKISFRPTYDDVIPFILNAANTFKNLAIDKNIAFNINTNIDELFMEYAPDKLEKIIYNLLSNAFKYTLEMGKVTLTIKLIEHESIKTLQIEVDDTGIGISEENQKNIFSLYYQADNAQTSSTQGTGVGLYLVKTFTELHGGNINFTSVLNAGSSFIVQIPAKTKNSEFEFKNLKTLKSNIATQQLKKDTNKIKILIVEDNVDIRFFLKNELEEFFQIHSANNGIEALSLLNSYKPDIILSDVMMPKMDGYELCQKVKSNILTCHIPVVLLTAKISHESEMKGYSVGADDYLRKPFDSEILIVKIQRIMESRKQIQEKVTQSTGIIPPELQKTNQTDSAFLQNLFQLLDKNLDNTSLDVEYLTKKLGISRTILYEKINILTGQPVADFIKTYRLNRAAGLIESGESIVSEIVWKVGFKSHAHFTRAFKQKFNCAPSKYIENSLN